MKWLTILKRLRKNALRKVNFEKAYDFIEWCYLKEVMVRTHFPHNWRCWINECLSSTLTPFLINGCPINKFSLGRGLRQCYPISLFLFLIAVEGFKFDVESFCQQWVV